MRQANFTPVKNSALSGLNMTTFRSYGQLEGRDAYLFCEFRSILVALY